MSSYFMLIAILVLVVSPLVIPAAITVVHALSTWYKNHRFNNPAMGLQRRTLRPAT